MSSLSIDKLDLTILYIVMEELLAELVVKDIEYSLSLDKGEREQKRTWITFGREISPSIREKVPPIIYRRTGLRTWWLPKSELVVEYIPD